jgi:Carboxypeptidase regulatory-like domain/TonB-dependent Receptor Plug Domain
MNFGFSRCFLAAALFWLVLGSGVSSAQTQSSAPAPPSTPVSGRIYDAQGGLPVPNATVELDQGTLKVATTKTDSNGGFTFPRVSPGTYTLLITAGGYQTSRSNTFVVEYGEPSVTFQGAIFRSTGLKTIAQVSTTGGLQATATLNDNLSPSVLQDQNYVRAGDALGTLPFITSSTSSSIGDDETLQLRGFDPSESVALLDGHPIGPLGACPAANNPLVGGACPYGNQGSVFDYQLAQFWGMSNINVTYGSGAMGLYGVPTLGGSVDFETLDPTPKNHLTVMQGFGDLGKSMTGLSYTGTSGPLSYALAYGVQGLDGEVNGLVTQNAMLSGAAIVKPLGGKDVGYCPNSPTAALYNAPPPSLLPADVAACTTDVSGAYTNRNALAKISYRLRSKTTVTLTAYNANVYADGVGNGDTNLIPYSQIYAQAASVLAAGENNFDLEPSGTPTTCSSTKLAVLNNSHAGYECLTLSQFASAFNGAWNKGPGVFHTGLNQDYHARVTQQLGAGTIVIDGYVDNYDYLNEKGLIIGYDEQDTWLSHGAFISDEYSGQNNNFSFGMSLQHQIHETNEWSSPPCPGDCYIGFPFGDTSYFIQDTYQPSKRFSIFSNLTLDNSQVSHTNSFDPRVSFVYRPDSSDVFRITGGHASISPDPILYNGGTYPPSTYLPLYNQLSSGALNGFSPSGALCTPLIPVVEGFNADVKPEQANDAEVALAHRFKDQATVEVDGYDTIETNPIITDVVPISILSAAQLHAFQTAHPTYFPNALSELNGPGGCGAGYTEADLGVSTPLNSGQAFYRGVNVSAKLPVTRQFEIDGNFALQTAYYDGLSQAVLLTNGGYVNGQQFYGIPTQTANIGIGYNNLKGALTVRIDDHYLGNNNGFFRPAFWYANANVSKTVGSVTFNVGISNLFNNDANPYGIMNVGTPYPQNMYVTSPPQLSEEFALPSRQIWMTTTLHI